MVNPDVYRPLIERYARGFFATRDSEGGEYRTADVLFIGRGHSLCT